MTDYNSYKSWPFNEAKKIVKRFEKNNPKDKIIFETGYGPSGLPHIGTFGEVLRTNMVRFCYEKLTGKETDLIAFSDDMDGFRKVPDNIPNKEKLSNYLDYPLTSVPDPFELFNSFGEHNNSKLKDFLNRFNFKSELLLAMYAVTDGFSGLNASFGMKGTGYNFLVHNMCRLPQSGGTWMIAEGGMGAVTNSLKNLAIQEGVDIETSSNVDELIITNNRISGVVSDSGQETLAKIVVGACDPFKLMNLATDHLSEDFKADLNSKRKMGTTLKLNLAIIFI